ncbi:unnamed protein product [Hermetia illucens]|uniref:DUF4797 domain-containing protein n=1 Tax=Hermetia illucens TaxID=343691 RepID=A0A7R8UKU3_HERIL|nr:uncharacterized protein LOC119649455 [Hermetia illucens]CAD7082682.1 unnamed protein product [Hermetia illucens]
MRENQLCPLDIQENRPRSISPLGISRCREFINDISRRISRRSHDGVISIGENDSEFTADAGSLRHSRKDEFNSSLELYEISQQSSGSEDWENSAPPLKREYRRSLSAVRSVLSDLTVSSKSLRHSLTHSGESSTKKEQTSQKKILRQPVSYTYLKGMSGLPTQRVPRSVVCSQYSCRRRFLV